MIIDASALLAFFDRNEPDHAAVSGAILESTEPLVVSPYVVAEVGYLVATRHGVPAELAVLEELSRGSFELASFGADDLALARQVIERYADQAIGVADASMVVLAERYRTTTIATFDRRHFEVLRTLSGARFSVVP